MLITCLFPCREQRGNFIIMDFQGFHSTQGDYVIKEVAAVSNNGQTAHFLFDSPRGRTPSISASWLQSSFHGLSWSSGFIPYYKLQDILMKITSGATNVYVKGEEKKLWRC